MPNPQFPAATWGWHCIIFCGYSCPLSEFSFLKGLWIGSLWSFHCIDWFLKVEQFLSWIKVMWRGKKSDAGSAVNSSRVAFTNRFDWQAQTVRVLGSWLFFEWSPKYYFWAFLLIPGLSGSFVWVLRLSKNEFHVHFMLMGGSVSGKS